MTPAEAVKALCAEQHPRLSTVAQAVAAIPVHAVRAGRGKVSPALVVAEQLYAAFAAANHARIDPAEALRAYLLQAAREGAK